MKIISLLILSLMLVSCTHFTKDMWKKPNYQEEIAAFLLTEDGKTLVVIGEKYHYIFEIDDTLKKILLSDQRKLIKPEFKQFEVDRDNEVSGRILLKYSSKNLDDYFMITKLGFSSDWHGRNYFFTKQLKGKRYTTNKEINTAFNFNHPYSINIRRPPSMGAAVGKVLLTPITVALDGAVTVASVPLFPIILFMGSGSCN
jgi:hypothetical protein